MRPGPDWNAVAGDIQIEFGAHGGYARKSAANPLRLEMRQVQINVRMPGLFHLANDGQAHHVPRGKFAARIVVGHEAPAVAVDQPGPGPARGLGDQVPAAACYIQHRGMELHELHVSQFRACAIGHGHAVAGGDLGIGGFAIDLARTAAGQDRLLRPDHGLAVPAVPDQRPAARAVMGQKIDGERVFPNKYVGQILDAADRHSHYLLARGVAQGMCDAVVTVPAFARQSQALAGMVELHAPVDQLLDPLRRLANHVLDHLPIAQRSAGHKRVLNVILEPVRRIQDPRNAALGHVAVGLHDAVLGNHHHR